MNKLKYLLVFSVPATVYISFHATGIASFLPAFVFFGLVPLLECIIPKNWNQNNASEDLLNQNDGFYNLLLYLQVPIVWSFLYAFLCLPLQQTDVTTRWGQISAMGILLGIISINLGHELGHRQNRFERFLGELLLLSSLENHFLPYHNRGHHTNVATPNDPATARKNEWLFVFWMRSQIGSYVQAWQIELQRMKIVKRNWWHPSNKMIQYTFAQLTLLASIYFTTSGLLLCYFIFAAFIGIILLETVNYIEHYGLLRKQNVHGHFEIVKRHHSWNSNHLLGRAILFELSRHSEHHFKPDLHYQHLDSKQGAPTMPTGYPGMMLLSMLPPLFFRIMNPKVERLMNGDGEV
ncbi:MAG: alkane 1-monooxygenase [Flavobacteriales bacterium]